MKKFFPAFKHHAILCAVALTVLLPTAMGQDYYSRRPNQVEVVPTAYSSMMDHYYSRPPNQVEVVPTAYSSMMDHYYKSVWENHPSPSSASSTDSTADIERENRALERQIRILEQQNRLLERQEQLERDLSKNN